MQFWLEFLYDYFLVVLSVAIFSIIFVLSFTTWIIRHQITTKVLVIKGTTHEFKNAKEMLKDNTVVLEKQPYQKIGNATVGTSLLRPYRLWVMPEDSDKVYAPEILLSTKQFSKIKSSDIKLRSILESEGIEQSIRGLTESTMQKVIYMLAGGTIFIFIWEILRGIFA